MKRQITQYRLTKLPCRCSTEDRPGCWQTPVFLQMLLSEEKKDGFLFQKNFLKNVF